MDHSSNSEEEYFNSVFPKVGEWRGVKVIKNSDNYDVSVSFGTTVLNAGSYNPTNISQKQEVEFTIARIYKHFLLPESSTIL